MRSILFVFLWISTVAYGHGEDAAGPQGGYVRMPGALHTELVLTSKTEFKLYLHDMQISNPTVSGSSVRAHYKRGKKKSDLNCMPQTDFFLCTAPKGIRLVAPGKIIVSATREGVVGEDAVYDLPLKFFHH